MAVDALQVGCHLPLAFVCHAYLLLHAVCHLLARGCPGELQADELLANLLRECCSTLPQAALCLPIPLGDWEILVILTAIPGCTAVGVAWLSAADQ